MPQSKYISIYHSGLSYYYINHSYYQAGIALEKTMLSLQDPQSTHSWMDIVEVLGYHKYCRFDRSVYKK